MMRYITCLLLSLFSIGSTLAQSGEQSLQIQRDSVPVTTIVPIEQPAASLRDTITKPVDAQQYMTRCERRSAKAKLYAFHIDSLVATRSLAFYPTTMKVAPNGKAKRIYADYFYAYFSPVDLEVHLPVERGHAHLTTMMNFDTDGIRNYASAKYLTQWNISFTANDDGSEYRFWMEVSTVTGRTELTIEGPDCTMQYEGSIGERARQR